MGLYILKTAMLVVLAYAPNEKCGMREGVAIACSAEETCQKIYDKKDTPSYVKDQCDVIMGWDEEDELDQKWVVR